MNPLLLDLKLIEEEISRERHSSTHGFKGSCHYYHYGMQGIDDRGWGCGYRTLQTILSWFILNQHCPQFDIPDLFQIQEMLCKVGDKPAQFHHSKDWIGSFECGIVVEILTQCKFRMLHVPVGHFTEKHLDALRQHFIDVGSPIMMGGCEDNSSKCILAIREGLSTLELLICDPHFYSVNREPSLEELCHNNWIQWRQTSDLSERSFYNLCLPLASSRP